MLSHLQYFEWHYFSILQGLLQKYYNYWWDMEIENSYSRSLNNGHPFCKAFVASIEEWPLLRVLFTNS